MPDHPVLLDTVALISLVRRRDALHAAALSVMKELGAANTPLVVTEWVLSEFLSAASAPQLRGGAAAYARRLMASPRVTVVEATHADFERALALFERRHDKAWSLVDCTSILVGESHGIRRVFTHDAHFTQAGFEVLRR